MVCSEVRLSDRRRRAGLGICARCDDFAVERTELVVRRMLARAHLDLFNEPLPVPSAADNVMLGGTCGGGLRRPDMCWVANDRIVHLEIDEDSHGGRPVACEIAKLDETNFGVAGRRVPTITLRFNPDNAAGAPPLAVRVNVLARALRALFCGNTARFCQYRANVAFMFYGPRGAKHISAARAAAGSILVFSHVDATCIYDNFPA